MVTRIRNINPVQLAIVAAIIAAVVVFVEALFVFVAGSIGGLGYAGGGFGMNVYGMAYGAGALVAAPLLSALGGFIGGLIIGLVYNFVAARTGGIEVTLETVQTTIT